LDILALSFIPRTKILIKTQQYLAGTRRGFEL
jgi:hypothetical protein